MAFAARYRDHLRRFLLGALSVGLEFGREHGRMPRQQLKLVAVTQQANRRVVAVDDAVLSKHYMGIGGALEQSPEPFHAGFHLGLGQFLRYCFALALLKV